jgi:hypothetical protein
MNNYSSSYRPSASSSRSSAGPLESLIISNKSREGHSTSSYTSSTSQPKTSASPSNNHSRSKSPSSDLASLEKEFQRKRDHLQSEKSRIANLEREKKTLVTKLEENKKQELKSRDIIRSTEETLKELEKRIQFAKMASQVVFRTSDRHLSSPSSRLPALSAPSTSNHVLLPLPTTATTACRTLSSTVTSSSALGHGALKFCGVDLKYKPDREVLSIQTFSK